MQDAGHRDRGAHAADVGMLFRKQMDALVGVLHRGAQVLGELLGYDAARIAALETQGVTRSRPT